MDSLYKRLDKFEQKLDSKLDTLDSRIDSIDLTLAKQESQLALHIKRTEIAEENIKMLRTELKPVEKHVAMMNGGLKLLGILSVLSAIIASIVQIIK